ncbi:MAG: two-component system response regulator, partial [Deltaproteobacteria bacterium]|nr:two-component system response regulator [Deltaproteobacteria bacterium]
MNPPKRVLVIDDEPDLLDLVSMRLEANHFRCFTALSAEEGLRKAHTLKPKLILLDL